MAHASYGGYDGYWLTVTPLNHNDCCGTSSDDLSSDWETDEARQNHKTSGWKRVRNLVRCTPFIQTYKKQKYPWIQLAGHQGNFKAGHHGTILKKFNGTELTCLENIMNDVLRPFVPEYKGKVVLEEDETYLELEDLLANFETPCVMDIKIGVRTYSEEELAKAKENPKLRKDMYEKMIQIDDKEPTEEEHKLKAVTKPRYMVWRETISSTATLGFRVEGIKKADGTTSKDFKRTKTKEQVMAAILDFTDGFPFALRKYYMRLQAIYDALEKSSFFLNHEFIGSSLLFVHDMQNANIWLIDFAKTVPVPPRLKISHKDAWQVGNHEDGYLIGITNLLNICKSLAEEKF